MMLKHSLMLMGALALVSLCACQTKKDFPWLEAKPQTDSMSAETSPQDMVDRFNKAVLGFYKSSSNAYYLMGYECFALSKDLREQNKLEEADEFARKAKLYKLFADDLETRHKTLSGQVDLAPAP